MSRRFGRWVNQPGGVKVWHDTFHFTYVEWLALAVLHRMATLNAPRTTCRCGCLLLTVGESCPACRLRARGENLR